MTLQSRLSASLHLLRVDARLIGFYIFAFAAGGVVRPFLNLYLKEIGLTGAQIGMLQGLAAFTGIAVTPLIGVVADRMQRHRLLLGCVIALKGLSSAVIPLSQAWLWLASTVSLRVMTAQAQDALTNQLTLVRLQHQGRMDLGAVRFWGALSFAATSLLAGWLARDGTVAVLFPLAGLFGLLAVLFVGVFPARIADQTASSNMIQRPQSRELWFLLGIIFLFMVALSGPETFAFIYIAEELGAGNDLIGLLGAVVGLAPLVALPSADRIVRRWGAILTMVGGFGLYVCGWVWLVLVRAPLGAVWFSCLIGAGNSLYLISMVILLRQLSAPRRAATNQMLAQLTVPGLAMLIAQPLSGWIYDAWGGGALFVLDAVLAVVALSMLLWRRHLVTPRSLQQTDEGV